METKQALIINSEEELFTAFNKLYKELNEEDFYIDKDHANDLLAKLNIIEKKAKEYGVVSSNESLKGIYFCKLLILFL